MAPSAGEDGVAAAARAQGPGSTKTATFPTVVLEGVTAAELFDTRSTGGIVAPAEVRRRRARAERGGDGGPGRKSAGTFSPKVRPIEKSTGAVALPPPRHCCGDRALRRAHRLGWCLRKASSSAL